MGRSLPDLKSRRCKLFLFRGEEEDSQEQMFEPQVSLWQPIDGWGAKSSADGSGGGQMWGVGVQTSGLKQNVGESAVSAGLSPSFPLCFSFLSTSPEEVGLVPRCLLFRINVCSGVCLWHLKEATYCTRTQWLKASFMHSFMHSSLWASICTQGGQKAVLLHHVSSALPS